MVVNRILLGSPPSSGRAVQPGGSAVAAGVAPPCLLFAVSVDCAASRLATRRIALRKIRNILLASIGFASSFRPELRIMSWLVILLAAIGASLILGALTFVSALIGGLVTSMIVLMCGPLIDRLLAPRNRRSV